MFPHRVHALDMYTDGLLMYVIIHATYNHMMGHLFVNVTASELYKEMASLKLQLYLLRVH